MSGLVILGGMVAGDALLGVDVEYVKGGLAQNTCGTVVVGVGAVAVRGVLIVFELLLRNVSLRPWVRLFVWLGCNVFSHVLVVGECLARAYAFKGV